MAALLVIARFALHALDAAGAEDHYRTLGDELRSVPGFGGQFLGRKEGDESRYLAVARYADRDSAERGLVTVAQHPLREKLAVPDGSLMDVARYTVASEGPGGALGIRPGGYLSLTVRTAEPGRAEELADDLEIIFGELSVIPGFSGYAVGFHESLPEQACALAAWTRKEAFARSLPEGRIHDVELYRRVV